MKITILMVMLFSLVALKDISAKGDSLKIYSAILKFDPSRNPAEDLRNAAVEAQRSDRRIILDVGGEWCIWCHRIDEFIENNKDVSSLLHNNFVVVKVNYSPENKNEKFLSRYPKIPGYPHFFVLGENGKLVHSQDTGKLEKKKGYDKEKFISFLKKWAPHKKINSM